MTRIDQTTKSKGEPSVRLTAKDYTVAWVCALPNETTAAMAMLDVIHLELPTSPRDNNTYTLGSIGKHNIVIACLPKGQIGNISSAVCAMHMMNTFPSIKVGLMVGIGGGIPSSNVRLGDVVVSAPVGQYPGVVQWDMGEILPDGRIEKTGVLNKPPRALLAAVAKLQTRYRASGSMIPQYLAEVEAKWPALGPEYTRPPPPTLVGMASNSTSSYKESQNAMIHPQRIGSVSVLHGLILSGDSVIKRANIRDEVNDSLGGIALCFEMEAAGLMDTFPCIVIRGICDYADERKNDNWQPYAAGVAAAYAKELLQFVQLEDVARERPLHDLINHR